MGLYTTPAPGVRQKKPQIVKQQSKAKGVYFAVRTFEPGIAPKGHIRFRASTEKECQAFIDNDCKALPKKKATRKKKASAKK